MEEGAPPGAGGSAGQCWPAGSGWVGPAPPAAWQGAGSLSADPRAPGGGLAGPSQTAARTPIAPRVVREALGGLRGPGSSERSRGRNRAVSVMTPARSAAVFKTGCCESS